MEYKDILVSGEGPVGVITLNSPQTVNALSKNMIGEIIRAFRRMGEDPTIRVIIVRANGKNFSAGHYLKEMIDGSTVEYKFIFDQCSEMMMLVHQVPQPVMAQVHGVATAAGCQLVATCDLAIADETARFATPGVRIGLFCTTPMVALSRAVARKHAMEMLMTGGMISADDALRFGLVNKVVPEAELEKTTMDLALSLAESSPLVLAMGKKAFYTQIEMDEPRAYEFAGGVITVNLMTDDAQEGIKAFLEKRKPTWKGR